MLKSTTTFLIIALILMTAVESSVKSKFLCKLFFCLLVVLGLTALRDSISVYIGPSPKEREKEKRKDR